jgi:hypothetical protein
VPGISGDGSWVASPTAPRDAAAATSLRGTDVEFVFVKRRQPRCRSKENKSGHGGCPVKWVLVSQYLYLYYINAGVTHFSSLFTG